MLFINAQWPVDIMYRYLKLFQYTTKIGNKEQQNKIFIRILRAVRVKDYAIQLFFLQITMF
jgi:hypothetical protein